MTARTTSYVKQFDALRFFAAFLTVIYHILLELGYQLPAYYGLREYVARIGPHCVTFFFVLSGFLITWLLLKEKDKTGDVHIRDFYARRVLRIWPLYYLILVVGIWVLPKQTFLFLHDNYYTGIVQLTPGQKLLWLTFFANACKMQLMPNIDLISHTWSIAVEEQFYAVWPWIVKRSRNILMAMAGIVLAFAVLRFGIYPWAPIRNLMLYIEFMRFDCMALGGVLAWFFYKRPENRGMRLLAKPAALHLFSILALTVTLVKPPIADFTYYQPFLMLVYAGLLGAIAQQPDRYQGLNHPALRYLGRISYGVYMYHPMAILVALNVIQRMGQGSLQLFSEYPVGSFSLFVALSVALTLGTAALSYRFLEMPFLRLKAKMEPKPAGVSQ